MTGLVNSAEKATNSSRLLLVKGKISMGALGLRALSQVDPSMLESSKESRDPLVKYVCGEVSTDAAKLMSNWTDVGLLRAVFYATCFSVFCLLDGSKIGQKGLTMPAMIEPAIGANRAEHESYSLRVPMGRICNPWTLTGYPYPRILPTGIFNKFRLIVAFRTQNILLHHELPMGTHTGKTLMGNLDPWIRVLQIELDVWTLMIQMAIHGAQIFDEQIHRLVASWSKMGFGMELEEPKNTTLVSVDEVALAVQSWNSKLTAASTSSPSPREDGHRAHEDFTSPKQSIEIHAGANPDSPMTESQNPPQLHPQLPPTPNLDQHEDTDSQNESDAGADGHHNVDEDGDMIMAQQLNSDQIQCNVGGKCDGLFAHDNMTNHVKIPASGLSDLSKLSSISSSSSEGEEHNNSAADLGAVKTKSIEYLGEDDSEEEEADDSNINQEGDEDSDTPLQHRASLRNNVNQESDEESDTPLQRCASLRLAISNKAPMSMADAINLGATRDRSTRPPPSKKRSASGVVMISKGKGVKILPYTEVQEPPAKRSKTTTHPISETKESNITSKAEEQL
ncbi:hypothetical protein BD410DRAFT_810109, partial [Rickenella mellea]